MQDGKPPKRPYPALDTGDFLGAEDTAALPTKNFKKLQTACLTGKDLNTALNLSAQMAILYGVPGLIARVQVYKKILAAHPDDSEEPFDTDLFRALRWLYLAKQLCETDPSVHQYMQSYLANEHINDANYWRQHENALRQLSKNSNLFWDLKDAAEEKAKHDCQVCLNTKK